MILRYRGDWGESRTAFMHLTILFLSDGDISRVREWVTEVNFDYRDVLVTAWNRGWTEGAGARSGRLPRSP
jgi:hypothetical protein